MTAEEWRPIPSAPGYMASSHGRVRSHLRVSEGHVLTPAVNRRSGGYLVISTRIDGVQKTRTVHSLVTEAFHGTRPAGAVVRHLDGDPVNNTPENLRWGTYQENNLDTVRHGRGPKRWGLDREACQQGHPFTPENTYVRPDRMILRCRQCDREQVAARRARRRLEVAAARGVAA